MPPSTAQQEKEATQWLSAIKGRFALKRPVIFVPGICNEDGRVWDTFMKRGRECIPNWDADTHVLTFVDLSPCEDFIDFGVRVRQAVREKIAEPSWQGRGYDMVCYSMGGLDSMAALVPVLNRYPFADHPAMSPPHYLITLDTPFHGFPNFAQRMKFGDMKEPEFPRRPAQCAAMSPTSHATEDLLARRNELAGTVERIVCYSASGDSVVQVPVFSSNLCSDEKPASLWPVGGPQYTTLLLAGTTHAGTFGIMESTFGIASVFGRLLFDA